MLGTPKSKLGPYEILGLIGAGGMGEVYRARDTRVDRTVALKIVNKSSVDRFDREARAISSLNHPHICTLYDLGTDGATSYLVMEYVQGEPLKGPLPLAKTFEYAVQIAEALDAAHRRGIVHRDLKPANILVTKSGVKLLDFGLARLDGGLAASAGAAAMSCTVTVEGAVLGTLQYMSPEQMEGKPADARADIFSFGLVLYEMLTGRVAFEASSAASLIAATLTAEPKPVREFQPLTPTSLERVVKKCLAKDPDQRWQSARDLADELKWIGSSVAEPATAVQPSVLRRSTGWMVVTGALLCVAGGVGIASLLRGPSNVDAQPITSEITLPGNVVFPTSDRGHPVLSPDGQWIVFIGRSQPRGSQLWVRPIKDREFRALEGTDRATYPFWSPDSQHVAFFADGKLKRVAMAGGAPAVVADAPAARGGSWSAEGGGAGTILFAGLAVGQGIMRVPASGGTPVPVTVLGPKDLSHRQPRFLPGGKRFLFAALGQSGWIGWADLGDNSVPGNKLIDGGHADYAPSATSDADGHLLFAQKHALWARRLDVKTMQFNGEPFQIAAAVQTAMGRNSASVSAAHNLILYRPMPEVTSEASWFDRAGRRISTVSESKNANFVAISPAGDKAAMITTPLDGNGALWIHDLSRNVATPLDKISGMARPIGAWSPDGRFVATSAETANGYSVFIRDVDGARPSSPVFSAPLHLGGIARVEGWTPDGEHLILVARVDTPGEQAINGELQLLRKDGNGKPVRLTHLPSNVNLTGGALSPNGKWIAYSTDESGRMELYVREFRGTAGLGARWKISTDGGAFPKWRGDGRELFYLNSEGMLTAVPIGARETFEAGTPVLLFTPAPGFGGISYDVTRDGQRFLAVVPNESILRVPMILVSNWLRR